MPGPGVCSLAQPQLVTTSVALDNTFYTHSILHPTSTLGASCVQRQRGAEKPQRCCLHAQRWLGGSSDTRETREKTRAALGRGRRTDVPRGSRGPPEEMASEQGPRGRGP